MLSERFSREFLAQCLIPFENYHPYPQIDEREPWNVLAESVRDTAVSQGESYLDFEWPVLSASRYMDFRRDGNRSRYEGLYFNRRSALGSLVMAECVENKGRFTDQIINGIWCICEESSWIVPAHNPGEPLPDAFDPSVDLFATDTGALLAWVNYLVGNRLDEVSPIITERIRREVEHRILTPFLTEDIHWMGFNRASNNWNPWCTSNCLASALLLEQNPERRLSAVERSLRILDNWLSGYAPDGGCDEGPGYWGVAGACLFNNLELLYGATGGKLDVYDEPLVVEIGRYIVRMHIDDNYYVNFADGSARVDVEGSLIYRYGRSIGDEAMMALGSNAFRRSNNLSRSGRWYSFTRVLPTLWDWDEISAYDSGLPYLRDVWMPGIQVMAAREQSGSSRGLYLAVKGGHNMESHNHNDIGNFIVYADGLPMLIDAGVETYTANTFNENRWKIWTMQSAYHNLSTVRGVMQPPGGRFRAGDVSYICDDAVAELSLNIAGAYPGEAGIDKWQRICRLHRGREAFIEVLDEFSLEEPTSDITMTLLTAYEPDITEGELTIRDPAGPGIRVAFDSSLLSAKVEPIQIDDARLSAVWGPKVYRVLLQPKKPVSNDCWQMTVRML